MNGWMDIVNSLVMEECTMYNMCKCIILLQYMKMKWIDDLYINKVITCTLNHPVTFVLNA